MSGDQTSPPRVFGRDAVRLLDGTCGIDGPTLMARAARGAAEHAVLMTTLGDRVLICCGTGNNGGDGWAMAPILAQAGRDVAVVAPAPPKPGSDADSFARRATARGIPVLSRLEEDAALIVDGLLGTGLDRPVFGPMAALIDAVNAMPCSVLAIDIPSGLDADTGTAMGSTIRAACTATLAGLKRGFLNPASNAWTGQVHVVDLGMPSDLMDRLADPPPAA